MQLYNSLSRKIEQFQPHGDIKFYTCGITPYDTTHLGHAFTYIVSDILIRFLESQDHKVIYVQNVTDIDDDILKRARREAQDWRILGNRWTRHFIEDMKLLNVRPPDHYPRATDVIPSMVDIIQNLLKERLAYENSGSVYFGIDSWSQYGKLSRLSREKMLPIANQRGNNPDDPNKRSPLDFVLWQARVGDEPSWDSPWGQGRPGWHIECSTMSTRLLGNQIDIHSGGEDLLFPHHECEIAQVEPLTGHVPFVRFWMHVAMVYQSGEKMSKSLGNLVMIKDLLKSWSADAVRIYLCRHHYRSPWSYQISELEEAARFTHRIEEAVTLQSGRKASLDPQSFQQSMVSALDNDLDTPAAFDSLSNFVDEIISAAKSGKNTSDAQETLSSWGNILGLRMEGGGPQADVLKGWDDHLKKFEDK